jgi:hypothetical protein
MENQKVERSSGIELLKIFAIVIIIFSHAMPSGDSSIAPYYMDLSLATKSIQRMLIVLFKYGGQLGNDIFIVSSAWFLLESKRMNIKKVMYLITDCFTVSVCFLICFLVAGYDLGTREIIKQFMPTYMASNWFICCYILFYMIHPILNMAINALDKEKLLITDIGMVIIYCGLQFIRPDSMYYSRVIGFICIYFIVAYVKKYLRKVTVLAKVNKTVLILSLLANLMLILTTNYLGLHIGYFLKQLTKWNEFINPFLILSALSMFLMAKQKKFVNHMINYISGLSMLIYIIHANSLIIGHIIFDFFEYIYNTYTYQYELLWVTLVAVVLMIFGLVMGIVYKNTLQKLSHGICDLIYRYVTPKCRYLLNRMLELE